MTASPADDVLARARKDDPACATLLAACEDPETLGELLVAVHATGTPAAARAVAEALRRPFRRGAWQGFKRLFKLLEARLVEDDAPPADHDLDLFAALVLTLDAAPRWGTYPVGRKTVAYLQRRAYRALKALGRSRPACFRSVVERLLRALGPATPSAFVLPRVLRATEPPPRAAARLVPLAESSLAPPPAFDGPDLLALDDEALVRPAPPPAAADAPPLSPPPPPWKGPIFVERWVEDPAWLVDLLLRVTHPPVADALARLGEERAGHDLLAVDLDRFYDLLRHPAPAAWRLGLSQVAQRARRERLRAGELAVLFERAAAGDAPDWPIVADVLAVLDQADAEAELASLLPALRDLVLRHPAHPGVDPIVDLLRRRLLARLVPPHVGWDAALALSAAPRPAARALGRDLVATCADLAPATAAQLDALLAGPLPQDAPDLVQRALVRPAARPGGYRPAVAERPAAPEPWLASHAAAALDRLPEPGFQALRRALLTFEEQGGLDPRVALTLVGAATPRARAVGLELLGGAVARGAYPAVELPRLLSAAHEDVVVWARERLEADAAAGRLPNEALYRVLDAPAADAQAFGRALVRAHLERFEAAELIVFCAESPDAATSDLGIGLYEERLRGQGLDLRALVPMFRILLYRPATARAEKERLYGLLRRWALEAPEHARLVVDVVGELRRTESKLDRSRVVRLLALVADRFPAVEVPFRVTTVFHGRRAGAWTSR
ncbi:MAG: hypothetical protein M9894_40015 [Planctomycetes bacterium]|nr:hypothetical protein [Planctomycetota bacterium]